MSKRIKVPRWFDKWAFQVEQEYDDNHFVHHDGDFKAVLISKILLQDLGKDFCDDPGFFQKGDKCIVYEEEYYTEERALYVARNKFDLIKAVIDGYEIEEEMGYVRLDGTEDFNGNSIVTFKTDEAWETELVEDDEDIFNKELFVTRAQYDKAPAWVKACDFVSAKGGGQDAK